MNKETKQYILDMLGRLDMEEKRHKCGKVVIKDKTRCIFCLFNNGHNSAIRLLKTKINKEKQLLK